MSWLRFFSRVAFICNICFLLVFVASFRRWLDALPNNDLLSDIIVLGYLVSVVINVLVNLVVMVVFLVRRLRRSGVPIWLAIVNFTVLILQLVLILNRDK